jgi:hypothetical protein
VILAAASAMSAAQISVLAIHDWPNERFSNQLPVLAIDGNTSKFTWSSESGSTVYPMPEPSSMWLIASVAAMIAVARRWRG